MNGLLKVGVSVKVPVEAYLSSDHVSAATGKTFTCSVSKNCAAYVALNGTISEISGGSYSVSFSTTDVSDKGFLEFWATAASTDAIKAIYQVVTDLPGDSVASVTAAVTLTSAYDAAKSAVSSATWTSTLATSLGLIQFTTDGGNKYVKADAVFVGGAAPEDSADIAAEVLTEMNATPPSVVPVSGTVTVVTGSVDSVTDPVTVASGTITSVTGSVDSVTDAVVVASGTVTAVTNGVIVASGTITAVTNAVVVASGTVTSVTNAVEVSSGTITAVTGAVDSVTDPVTVASGTITAVTGGVIVASGTITDVTNAVTVASGTVSAVTGNVGGTVNGFTAVALADLFDTDSGKTYGEAVAGSVVKEIADNAGGSALTEGGIADAVWNEAASDHDNVGSMGEKLNDAGAAADPWNVSLPGAYAAGKAGNILGNYLDTTMSVIDSNVDSLKTGVTCATGTITTVTGAVGSVTAAVTLTAAYDAAKSAVSSVTWTDAKAGYLDVAISSRASGTTWSTALAGNLDATVSSRASGATWTSAVAGRLDSTISLCALAATALSNATWTDAHANTIAVNLDAAVSTRASGATWTSAVAGRLDSTISLCALAATALSSATWTNAKAAYLDTTLSTLAPAATALSSATWTNAKAAFIDSTISLCSTLTQAQVNAEVVDVIRTDNGVELNAVPAATAPLGQQVQFVYQKIRNEETVSMTNSTIAKSDGTVIATSTLSDVATVFTKTKYS